MSNKKNKSKDLFTIAIFTLITALVWMGTNAYHQFIFKKNTTVKKDLLTPLNPKLNQQLIQSLMKKEYRNQEELTKILSQQQEATTTPQPTLILTATPSSSSSPAPINNITTPSPAITQSPSATPSASP